MSVLQRFDSMPSSFYARPASAACEYAVPAGWAALAEPARASAVIQRICADGYPAAAAELTHTLNTCKPSAELHAMRALCLLHMGAHAKAAQDLAEACALAPHRAVLFALNAIALADVHSPGAAQQARASLAQARLLGGARSDSEPSFPYYSLANAKLALLGGHYRAALHAIDTAVQVAPRCALTRSVQADITLQLAGPARALIFTQTREPLVLQSPHMQALVITAQAKLGAADPRALAACAKRVQALGMHGATVPYTLLAAAFVAQSQKRGHEAQRLWDRAPQDVVQMWLPGQMHRAAVLVGIDPLAAADALRKIPAACAQHPGVRELRAQVMEATHRPALAKQSWARLAHDTEGSVRTAALWAQAGRPMGSKVLSEADRATLEALVQHAPLHTEALYQLANDALARGQTQRAIDFAQRLLATGDERGRAHFILGMTRFGPAPAGHFRQYLQAPKRDASLLDEARLYIAHQAFASAQWDEAIDQVRAMPSDALAPDTKQTLAYLEAQCHEGLVLRGAEESIAAVRCTLSDTQTAADGLKAALSRVEHALGELGAVAAPAQTPPRLALLGQKAWLHLRLGQSKAASACLASARALLATNPNDLTWPAEAERTEANLRAARFLFVQHAIGYLLELLQTACRVLGAQVLSAGLDYLERFLKEHVFARKDADTQVVAF